MSLQKQWNIVYRSAAFFAFLLALIGGVFAFIPKVSQYQEYQKTIKELKGAIDCDEKKIKELRRKQDKFSTDKHFVQKIAHETGFAHSGEVIFQFEDEPATNSSKE